jgi:hypothetical protein
MAKRSSVSVSITLALTLASALAHAHSAGSAVPIYDATQLAMDRFTVVKRVGIQDWSSAFWIRGHRDLGSAQQAIVNEAARVGADGVINLTCFDQTDRIFNPAGYFCYGNAIRLKK